MLRSTSASSALNWPFCVRGRLLVPARNTMHRFGWPTCEQNQQARIVMHIAEGETNRLSSNRFVGAFSQCPVNTDYSCRYNQIKDLQKNKNG